MKLARLEFVKKWVESKKNIGTQPTHLNKVYNLRILSLSTTGPLHKRQQLNDNK